MFDLIDKKILVTGSTGFLGSVVLNRLKKIGCSNVIGVNSKNFDLRDKDAVSDMYRQLKPQVLFNMAAVVGGIYFNQKFPAKLMHDNLLININIVEQAKEFGLEKLVNVGTVCSYPKYCQIPFNEDDLEKGEPDESNKPYGDVKRIALTLQKAYYDQYGLKSCFALPINLYGPKDSLDLENSHVIPGLIMKTLNAQKDNLPTVKFWGTGNPTRQMLHTRDLADGLILMAEKMDYPTPINFASSEEMTIKELVQKVFNILEYKGEAVWDMDKPDGQPRRKLNISKAKELLGWTPKIDFDTGLRETIEWYKVNYHGR